MRLSVAALGLLLVGIGGCCIPTTPGQGGLVPNGNAALLADHAIIATSEGIVALTGRGKRVLKISDGSFSWCQVDNRALVVWAASEADNGQVTLFAYDLAQKGRQLLSVGPMRMPEAWRLKAGAETLETRATSHYRVGVTIDVQTPGGIRVNLGCKGLGADPCVGNQDTLSPTMKAWKGSYASVRLPETIRTQLARRGANRRFVGPMRKATIPAQFPNASHLWLSPRTNAYIVGGQLRSGRGRLLFQGKKGCGWTGAASLVRRSTPGLVTQP